ncbi:MULTISPECIES: LacI family DNA-binding transcriptional regulator [unclassified Actinomyces]|uniref:LacI family DNA-binding transcriptional regulator n=1 Tax=unclassified Actinomyces TaxID=2609248 RepID=UPI0013A6DB7B|nr:LacI family DNA-binding transcriptional regulator [Actinomyces sp. 594]MBW3070174.1 LacI family transcriptional regulator [Actinomyces sp. 594]NDR54808.1 LacI family transcriptional regulator [Actinomyces sp. 565]
MAARVTMSDVARRAGVSAKTVSNVLRGAPGASPETRQRVLEAVTALGYRLNPSASALRSGRRGRITLAIPTLQQPLYAALAQGLMRAAAHTSVVLELTQGEADREQEILAGSWAKRSDAAVLVPRGVDPASLACGEVAQTKSPLVLIADSGPPDLPRVSCPPEAQVKLVAAHLRALGRLRPAVVGVAEAADHWTGACVQGLRESGLRVDDDAVIRVGVPDGMLGGVEAVARLAHAALPVNAMVCHNDALAAGAVSALRRRGVQVPAEVVVVGRGNTDAAAFATPTLTSVDLDLPAMAEGALTLLGIGPAGGRREESLPPHLTQARLVTTTPALSARGSTVDGAGAGPERLG